MPLDHAPVVHAVLHGGPSHLPEVLRSVLEPVEDYKIKVPYLGGYEHFEREGESSPAVFRWTGRTKIAE
jgi:hypothetical protein